jgi:hypothetical protein
MRLTVLQQQTKSLQPEAEALRDDVSKQLESIKHLLWQGNVEEAHDLIPTPGVLDERMKSRSILRRLRTPHV